MCIPSAAFYVRVYVYLAPRSGPGGGISRPGLNPKKVDIFLFWGATTHHLRRFQVATPSNADKEELVWVLPEYFRVAS